MSVRSDNYFAQIPEWVLYADVSAHAVRLYGTLRRYADKEGRAHPSHRRLAEHIHASVATVRRSIAELVGIGALEVAERRDEEGRKTSNDYLVLSAAPVTGEQYVPVTGEQGVPVTGERGTKSQKEPEPEEPETTLAASRPRDVIWDALVAIYGEPAHDAERGRYNRAVRLLKQAGATPEQMAIAIAAARRHPEDWVRRLAGTPMAFATNWGEIARQLSETEGDDLQARIAEGRRLIHGGAR